MNRRILWTTALLTALTAAFCMPLSSYAELKETSKGSRVRDSLPSYGEASLTHQNRRTKLNQALPSAQLAEAVKVGEYQSQAETRAEDAVLARIHTHRLAERQAATLYVRNIPVITFLGSNSIAESGTKVGTQMNATDASTSQQSKAATIGELPNLNQQTDSKDPAGKAATVASRLNQTRWSSADANKITVKWKAKDNTGNKPSGSYLIEVNGEKLVEMDALTRLPDTTNDRAKDALQVTNRLRRILVNAPPIREIIGKPVLRKPRQIAAIGPVRLRINGTASWYGPGFHGNRSASGEVYNQNALTAAHRSLPFGTRVRVTHTGTGRSVIVKINDRGPFIGGRVIDLSAAAARIIGVMQTGVAPVRLEILGRYR